MLSKSYKNLSILTQFAHLLDFTIQQNLGKNLIVLDPLNLGIIYFQKSVVFLNQNYWLDVTKAKVLSKIKRRILLNLKWKILRRIFCAIKFPNFFNFVYTKPSEQSHTLKIRIEICCHYSKRMRLTAAKSSSFQESASIDRIKPFWILLLKTCFKKLYVIQIHLEIVTAKNCKI